MSDDYRSLLASLGDTHWWMAGMRRVMMELAGPAHGLVLDVGCGPGWDLIELPETARGIGIDRNADHVFFRPLVLAEAARLPFPDSSFDRVLALDLLDQRDVQPARTLAEIRRVLCPRGQLVLRVPANPWLQGPHDDAWGGARRFQRSQLEAMVRKAGLTPRRLTYANTFLFPAAVPGRLLARAGLGDGEDLRPMPGRINRLMLAVLSREADWLRNHDLPFGLSLLCVAERAEVQP